MPLNPYPYAQMLLRVELLLLLLLVVMILQLAIAVKVLRQLRLQNATSLRQLNLWTNWITALESRTARKAS